MKLKGRINTINISLKRQIHETDITEIEIIIENEKDIDKNDFNELCENIKGLSNLKKVSIRNVSTINLGTKLTPTLLQQVVKSIPNHIIAFQLTNFALTSEHFLVLNNGFASTANLKLISFENCDILSEGIHELFNWLNHMPFIHTLILKRIWNARSGKNLKVKESNTALKTLAEQLTLNHTISHLAITDNDLIDAVTWKEFATTIKDNMHLTHLAITQNVVEEYDSELKKYHCKNILIELNHLVQSSKTLKKIILSEKCRNYLQDYPPLSRVTNIRPYPSLINQIVNAISGFFDSILGIVLGCILGAMSTLIIHNPFTCFIATLDKAEWKYYGWINVFRILMSPILFPLIGMIDGFIDGCKVGFEGIAEAKRIPQKAYDYSPYYNSEIIAGLVLSSMCMIAVAAFVLTMMSGGLPLLAIATSIQLLQTAEIIAMTISISLLIYGLYELSWDTVKNMRDNVLHRYKIFSNIDKQLDIDSAAFDFNKFDKDPKKPDIEDLGKNVKVSESPTTRGRFFQLPRNLNLYCDEQNQKVVIQPIQYLH